MSGLTPTISDNSSINSSESTADKPADDQTMENATTAKPRNDSGKHRLIYFHSDPFVKHSIHFSFSEISLDSASSLNDTSASTSSAATSTTKTNSTSTSAAAGAAAPTTSEPVVSYSDLISFSTNPK